MGVPTHWGDAGNGGAGGDQVIYHPPLEHGRTIHYYLSYHRLVPDGRAESRNAPIQEIEGEACPVYLWDKVRACIIGGRGGVDGGKESKGEGD